MNYKIDIALIDTKKARIRVYPIAIGKSLKAKEKAVKSLLKRFKPYKLKALVMVK